ncbi:MAG TPA: 2-dehydropantoate 2-reductase [Pseudolysinimonas sp.]|nr:2-dehydropantoate 2-reductase [Pseudolysinimonas sp.]
MRIAVLGAGAVGGTLAALLARAGHDITVTARGEHLDAIRAGGLRLEGGWGEYTAHVDAAEVLRERPELAILATKAQDAATALAGSAAVLEAVPLVVVQNGLGGLRVAHETLPSAPLLGGLALLAASYLSPGVVTVTGANPMILGAGPGADVRLLERIAVVMREALPIEVTPDIDGAQWTKLLINHVNALPAITGLSVQQVVAHPGLRRVMTASMRETVRVAGRLGVRFGTVQGVSGRILSLIGVAPLWLGAQFPRLLARRMGSVPNPGSTLQSLRRGRLTEIDFLNGAVVDAARAGGLAAPVNAAIVEMVHEVERTGVFLTPDQVISRSR